MPQEELEKLKAEIQSEYLAAFQKTVAMHEVFLLRLCHHEVLREDSILQSFLEYDKDVRCPGPASNPTSRFSTGVSILILALLATHPPLPSWRARPSLAKTAS